MALAAAMIAAAAAIAVAVTAAAGSAGTCICALSHSVGVGGVDDHTAVTALALALAADALHLADGRVDDAALVGVHGLHGKAAAGAAHLGTDALCQCGQVALALVAVTGHVEAQLDVVALEAVCHEACQIGQALHRLAAAADEGAHLLAVQTDDGSLTLLHSAELDVLYAHLLDDFLQVVHSGLDLGVLLDVDGDFHLFALGGGSSLLFGRGSFLSGCGRLFHSSGSFRGSLFDDRLSHRSSLLLHNGSGLLNGGSRSCHRLVRQLDADADLGGSELQAQKTGLLGHFQHFVADVDVVLFHAQQSAGVGACFIDRFAGRFLRTDHNRQSSFLFCSSLSGTVRSSL